LETKTKDQRKYLLLSLLAGFLLIFSPFLSFLSENFDEPSFTVVGFLRFAVIIVPAVFTFSVLIGFLLSKMGFRFFVTSQVAFGVIFFLSFTHEALYLFTNEVYSISSVVFSVVFVLLLIIIYLSILVQSRYANFLPIFLIFAVVTIVIPSADLIRSIWISVAGESENTVAINQEDPATKPKTLLLDRPNVYYFIIDAHPSVATMRSRFDVDLSDFVRKMESMDFYQADRALAVYPRTIFALGAILNADYFPKKEITSSSLFPKMMIRKKAPRVISTLADLGYKFYWFGNYYAPCKPTLSICLQQIDSYSIPNPVRVFLRATPLSHFENWLLNLFGTASSIGQKVDAISGVQDSIRSQQNGFRDGPYFVFAHHLSPHPPYQYNEDCSLRGQYKFDFKAWSKEGVPLFIDNVKCSNKKMLEIASLLVKKDPSAIIVFQSDHGSAFDSTWELPLKDWSDDAVGERYSTLNMIRLPQRCRSGLRQKLNNVNTMRLVLACLGNAKPDLLEDISFFTPNKKNPDYGKYIPFKVSNEGVVQILLD